MKTIYTAHSKRNYYAKQFVSAFVLGKGLLPLNPFMNWDYFLDHLVSRETIYEANEELIKLCDEVWQFGEVSNGCYRELISAMDRKIPIKFFTVGGSVDKIHPITDPSKIEIEDELASEIDVDEFRATLKQYLAK